MKLSLTAAALAAAATTAFAAPAMASDLSVGYDRSIKELRVTGTDDIEWADISQDVAASTVTVYNNQLDGTVTVANGSDDDCAVDDDTVVCDVRPSSVSVDLLAGDDTLGAVSPDDPSVALASNVTAPIDVRAGLGADEIHGGAGHDDVTGGAGADLLYGHGGNDLLDATTNDGSTDPVIDCGAGTNDVAWIQPARETVRDCETSTPNATAPGTLTGSFTSGQTVTASGGTFTGGNLTLAYALRRCNPDGTACVVGPPQASPVFALTAAMVGRGLSVRVIGTNAAGEDRVDSAIVGVVSAPPAPPKPVVTPPVVLPPPAAATFGAASSAKATRTRTSFRIATGQSVSCRAGTTSPCKVALSATTRRGSRTVRIGTSSATVQPGRRAALTLTLNKDGARLLRGRSSIKVSLSILVRQAGAADALRTASITVKRPKAAKRRRR